MSGYSPVPVMEDPAAISAMMRNMSALDKLRLAVKAGWTMLNNPVATFQHAYAPEKIRRELSPDLGGKRLDRGELDRALNYAGAYDWGIRPGVDPQVARDMALLSQLVDYQSRPEDSVRDYMENLAGLRAAQRDRQLGVDRRGRALLDESKAFTQLPEYAAGGLARFKECNCG